MMHTEVDEDNGTVTVCARVRSPFPVRPDCQLDIQFNVAVVSETGTAGECYLHHR